MIAAPRPVKFSFVRLRPPPSRASIAIDLANDLATNDVKEKDGRP